MKKKLLILGCSQTKRNAPGLLPAIDRYDGSPYRVLRNYLREREWPSDVSVAILSAKYGLMGGVAGIEDYDLRMNPARASEWSASCAKLLNDWGAQHSSIHFSLGKDYLPAVQPAIQNGLANKIELFEGPIGMKLNQIKSFLDNSTSQPRHRSAIAEPGSGKVSYFLPDWDDLLDENFDFESDTFSGPTPEIRKDKHCCVLMKPQRMCDGILVSLAQHITARGPLRPFPGTTIDSLAPKSLRTLYGLEQNQSLFGDCGAFSYVNEVEPSISVEQAISLYELHGFDYGASVDHIPIPVVTENGKKRELTDAERLDRVNLTKQNAADFIQLTKRRNVGFNPVGTVQALSADGYAQNVRLYHEWGYRHLALGGLVPLPDFMIEEIVVKVMAVVAELKPRPWIHLFGIFRPKLQAKFRELKVDSFDSASYFRKAWLNSGQNYLSSEGQWYAAIRVPMTKDGRTRKRLQESGQDIEQLEIQEKNVLMLLCKYDLGEVGINEVLDAVLEYDANLTRTSDTRSLRATYEKTLLNKPWKKCNCPFCKESGIHMLIFRGSNRNKRRGAHNTLMLYKSL